MPLPTGPEAETASAHMARQRRLHTARIATLAAGNEGGQALFPGMSVSGGSEGPQVRLACLMATAIACCRAPLPNPSLTSRRPRPACAAALEHGGRHRTQCREQALCRRLPRGQWRGRPARGAALSPSSSSSSSGSGTRRLAARAQMYIANCSEACAHARALAVTVASACSCAPLSSRSSGACAAGSCLRSMGQWRRSS